MCAKQYSGRRKDIFTHLEHDLTLNFIAHHKRTKFFKLVLPTKQQKKFKWIWTKSRRTPWDFTDSSSWSIHRSWWKHSETQQRFPDGAFGSLFPLQWTPCPALRIKIQEHDYGSQHFRSSCLRKTCRQPSVLRLQSDSDNHLSKMWIFCKWPEFLQKTKHGWASIQRRETQWSLGRKIEIALWRSTKIQRKLLHWRP